MFKNLSHISLSALLCSALTCTPLLSKEPEKPIDWRATVVQENNRQIENKRSGAFGQQINFNGQLLAPTTVIKSPAELEQEQQDGMKKFDRNEAMRRYAFPLSEKDLALLREGKSKSSIPFDFSVFTEENQRKFDAIKAQLAQPLIKNQYVLPSYRTNRVVLHGSSGNGKTVSVAKLAEEAHCCFMHVPSSLLVNEFQGSGSQNVKRKIDEALELSKAKNKRVVLLFDEIDMIARNNSGPQNNHQSEQSATATLWQMLDTYKSDARLYFVLATNNFESLDLRVRNRADGIEVRNPDRSKRVVALNFWFKTDGIDLEQTLKLNAKQAEALVQDLASRTDNFSARSLAELVHEFKRATEDFKDKPEKITKKLLYDTVERLKKNLFVSGLDWTRNFSIFGFRPLAALEGKFDYWKPALEKHAQAINLLGAFAGIVVFGSKFAQPAVNFATPRIAPMMPYAQRVLAWLANLPTMLTNRG